jgi:hypothetical protein
MRYLLKMAIALAIPVLMLTGCGTNHSWNQKLTVKVSTPNGEKTGSAVTRVSVTVGRQFATDTILSFGARGEATIIDLGAGKYLFVLLSNSGPGNTEYLADNTLGHLVTIAQNQDEISRLNAKYSAFEKLRGAVPVPLKNYPLLVTFTDINNPKSVKEVKPETMSDTLGPGFALKSIALEITDEPVTDGKVESVLGWLANEDDISAFWKSLYAGGFRPSGSIEVKKLFLSEG